MRRRGLGAVAGVALVLAACSGPEPGAGPPFLDFGSFGGAPSPGPERDVWVASADGEALRIDHRSGRIVVRLPVGAFPLDIAAGEGSVWVPSRGDGTITRIDARRNRVLATIAVGPRPTSIAAGEGSVWVLDGLEDTLSRIDPATNRVVSTAPVAAGSWDVAAGEGSVWLARPGEISRIDPETGGVTATYRHESFRGFLPHIAVGLGVVWITDTGTSLVWRIDTATNAIDSRPVSGAYPSNRAVAAGDEGSIWVATLDGIVRMNGETDAVTARLPIRGGHIAVGEEIVWIGDEGTGTLFKLDRPTGRLLQRIRLDDLHGLAIG